MIWSLLACDGPRPSDRTTTTSADTGTGVDTDTDGPLTHEALASASFTVTARGDSLGLSLAGEHDVDGDGVVDLFVGGFGSDADGMILHAKMDDPADFVAYDASRSADYGFVGAFSIDSAPGLLILGGSEGVEVFHSALNPDLIGDTQLGDARVISSFGMEASIVPDLDGDGAVEIATGEDTVFTYGNPCGTGWLFSSALTGSLIAEEDAWASVTGTTPYRCVATGHYGTRDLDGDGVSEYVIAGIGGETHDHGMNAVFYQLQHGTTSVDDADAIVMGLDGDWAAYGSDAGDIDGDGRTDLVIGGPQGLLMITPLIDVTGAGVARVYTSAPSGLIGPYDAAATLHGLEVGDSLGYRVAGPGDVDGDGHDDVLVGSLADAGGWVYLVHGPFDGEVEMSEDIVTRFQGDYWARVGGAIEPMGDLDGDGTADFALGALGDEQGGAYIYLGPW